VPELPAPCWRSRPKGRDSLLELPADRYPLTDVVEGRTGDVDYEAALEVLSDNNRLGVAQAQYGMGTLARARGDADMAVRHFEDATEIFREMDAWLEIARCLAGVGWVALARGDFNLAQARLAESLRINQACGQRLGVARGLEAFAVLAAARRQLEQASRLAGAATQLRESLGQPTGIGSRVEELLKLARDRLGAAAADALFAEGREMTTAAAVGYALGSHIRSAGGLLGTKDAAEPDEATSPNPARPPTSPLTAREHEIVDLIERGLSNREIADELVISPVTAARHVANILAKLHLTSRTQVASRTARYEPPS
jgi:DNA-binding CsgD family transcriptional regulator